MIQTQLSKIGVDADCVDYCYDGKDALEQLKETYQNQSTYKLVILDFNMPQMGGREASLLMKQYLLEKVQLSEDKLPPIIGLTGAATGSIISVLDIGSEDTFTNVYSKPMAYKQMSELIEKYYK